MWLSSALVFIMRRGSRSASLYWLHMLNRSTIQLNFWPSPVHSHNTATSPVSTPHALIGSFSPILV